MRPTCDTCKRDLRWFPETYEWGCDACRRVYPPSAGRVRAQVFCQGPNTTGTAYIGDLWLERDRVAFAATARVGGRFWGFVGAMLVGMIGGRRAARAAGRALWNYAPSFDKPGSIVLMGGELASVTKLRAGWELRLAPNQRGIERVIVRPYYAWPLEHLQSLVRPIPLPPLPAPRWPRPVPSGIETIGAALALFAFVLSDGVRARLQSSNDDERTLVLTVGVLGVLAAVSSLFALRSTARRLRPVRWLIAIVLLAMSGTAVGRAIHAYVDPPPPRVDRY